MMWLAWLGNVAFVTAAIAIARKRVIVNLALNGVGNSLYIMYGMSIQSPPLWALSLTLGVINVYSIVVWRISAKHHLEGRQRRSEAFHKEG